jgi:2-hydroxychromene-2-carboxylate isomerase
MAQLTFWFEFASTYSYLSAMRIEDMAKNAGVDIDWKPFLLGPIFKAQGWETSPFNLYQSKGFYMIRDIQRIAEARGLPFKMPNPFPQSGLQAGRLSLAGLAEGWGSAFIRRVFHAEFGEGRDISNTETLILALEAVGADAEAAFAKAQSADVKDRLRLNTENAQTKGLFGAPSFTTADGELFWGDDRLEQALAWCHRK